MIERNDRPVAREGPLMPACKLAAVHHRRGDLALGDPCLDTPADQGGVAVGSALRNERLVAARADGTLRLHREPV